MIISFTIQFFASKLIKLQNLLDKSVQYFNQIGLEISVDGRDKSVYTSTTGSPTTRQKQLTATVIQNGKKKLKHFHIMKVTNFINTWDYGLT